jgi:hypothetical protein
MVVTTLAPSSSAGRAARSGVVAVGGFIGALHLKITVRRQFSPRGQ